MDALKIRRLRHALGWTQAQMAEHVGVSQPLVSAWESGARVISAPAQRHLEDLMRLINAPADASVDEPPRDRILRTALELIASEGLSTLSLGRIAKEVGLSRSGVEHHFPTRQQLIDALLSQYYALIKDDLAERRDAHRDHPQPALIAYVEQGFSSVEGGPALNTQRAALLASLLSELEDQEHAHRDSVAGWYRSLYAQAHGPTSSPLSTLLMLASDAIWLLELLGWMRYEPHEKASLLAEAQRLIACDVSACKCM